MQKTAARSEALEAADGNFNACGHVTIGFGGLAGIVQQQGQVKKVRLLELVEQFGVALIPVGVRLPQLVQIVPPNETVVVIGFELKMGNRAGTMSLCIPYNVIEPIMGLLAAQNWFSYQRKGNQEDHLRKLTKNVQNAPVEARAFLAQTTMTMNELLSLQVGDLITKDAGMPLAAGEFQLAVGNTVPAQTPLRPIPGAAADAAPQVQGRSYAVIEEQIVIVDPASRKITAVLQRGTDASSVK